MRRAAIILLCGFGLVPGAAAQPKAADPEGVDLELVLAVDISYSMDMDELRVQRDGYVAAMTSKPVLDAILGGIHGRIAVTYVEWAGAGQQNVLIDWRIIDGPRSAEAFAASLAAIAPNRSYRTSISAALTFSASLFGANGYEGTRRVIDISGDGPNNQGDLVTASRDRVVAQNIAINGLPLALSSSGAMTMDIRDLEAYYRACVIGGPAAFVVPVDSTTTFAEAIRTKLVLEISGAGPSPRFMPTQAQRVNCTIGELMWRDRYGDFGADPY